MSSPAPATAMPLHVMVRINVGGNVFHTSLHTLMEGARRGGDVFRRGTSAWCPRGTRSMA